ncbi:ABC transporter substrate-binding protein [Massilia sp. PWRC2]|uniref:ABC transporter substrate-binding protein n=1 Tax=Massilia sp. PWRC2 TaxID=2804626 RepID=UPI003CF83B11
MLKRRHLLMLAMVLLAGAALAWRWQAAPAPLTLTIAVPTQLSSGAVFVARDHGEFARQALDVKVRSTTLGKQALQAVIDDQADLALVADVPFMLASRGGAPIVAIATVFASRQAMALVGRRDRGIGAFADIGGKTVGTIGGTNAQYFLDLMISTGQLPAPPRAIIDLPPDQLGSALQAGTVDAVTAWNPLLANMLQQQGSNAVVMRIPDLFVFRFLLVGKRSHIDAHPDAMRRTLLALAQAVQYIQAQPAPAQALIGAAVGLRDAQLAPFHPDDFALSLDQSLLLSLEDQTRWAVRKGLLAAAPAPNYLDALDVRPLTAVAPAAVTLIE